MIPITLRTRKNIFLGSDDWQEFRFKRRFDPAKTAILICDMWDLHWCAISTNRFNRIAHQMSDIIESANEGWWDTDEKFFSTLVKDSIDSWLQKNNY